MKNVAFHVPYQNCCGCGACINSCSKNALRMAENHEGFLVPVLDADKCIDCGLCMKACPALQEKRDNATAPECYAAQASNDIRAVSSSGGVFTPLAEKILGRGGVVCGAAFREDWTVHHIIVDNKEDLSKLRGSKYVQSDTEDCFKRIKGLLREGRWVLFSGTPCQVAGLYTYLGKAYDTLVTVDIFCHGAPSPGVWKRYLKENYEPCSIAKVNFRDKTAIGWSCSHVAITLKNGQKDVSNEYTKWFHSSVILRPACQDCKFSKLPRPADISLGDWWGIRDYAPHLNDGKGLSNVLISSDKGRELYESLNLPVSEKIQLSEKYGNGHLMHGMRLSNERQNFFSGAMPLNTDRREIDAITNKRYDICYVSIYYGRNYGSMLVSYAGYKILEDMGYSILVLNKPNPIWPQAVNIVNDAVQHSFAWRHFKHISPHYNNLCELATLNNYCSAFVVGGDQMFNPHLDIDLLAYIPFARKDKLKVCFSTSFGSENYNVASERLLKNKQLLQRFDKMAIREAPQNLIENVFELNVDEVIDSTLILPVEQFHHLADAAPDLNIEGPYLLTYNLDLNQDKEKAIVYIAEKMGLKIVNVRNLLPKDRRYTPTHFSADRDFTPEEFCKLYKNASFVVTDSYHGSCFSVIFRKPFVSIVNVQRGRVRYKMFDDFGLSHRFFSSPEEIYKTNSWMEPVDYTQAIRVIKKKSAYARKWLYRALNNINQKKNTRWMHEFIAHPVRNFFRSLRKALKK